MVRYFFFLRVVIAIALFCTRSKIPYTLLGTIRFVVGLFFHWLRLFSIIFWIVTEGDDVKCVISMEFHWMNLIKSHFVENLLVNQNDSLCLMKKSTTMMIFLNQFHQCSQFCAYSNCDVIANFTLNRQIVINIGNLLQNSTECINMTDSIQNSVI